MLSMECDFSTHEAPPAMMACDDGLRLLGSVDEIRPLRAQQGDQKFMHPSRAHSHGR